MIEYFLPAILLICFLTSREDLKTGKILNKHIITGLMLGVLINLLLIAFQIISLKYVLISGMFFIAMIAISFLGWNIGLWSAGDGKLFIVFAFLIPLTSYRYYTTLLLPLEIMINTLAILFLYVLFTLIFNTKWREKKKVLKKVLNWKKLLLTAVMVFGVYWLADLFFLVTGITYNYFLRILLMMAIYKGGAMVFKGKLKYILIGLSVLRTIIDFKTVIHPYFIITYLSYIIIFFAGLGFFKALGMNRLNITKISALQKGMRMADKITKDGKERHPKASSIFEKNHIELDEKELRKIKRLCKKHNIKYVKTYETIPSAIFISIAALLTVIFKGNIIIFLLAFLGLR